jgi:lycopene cyclase domain-containing protein
VSLNPHHLYLALNLGSFIVPFLFSFYPKAPFYKKWKYLFVSTLIPGVIFIVWDEIFTQMGVWGFNPDYLIGWQWGQLPLEEILFFFCIPYASVFTYEAMNYLVRHDYLKRCETVITRTLIFILIIGGLAAWDRWYTLMTCGLLAAFLVYLDLFLKPEYLSRFYFSYLIILIPFFLVNGVLTGSWIDEPVVWYNNTENLGVRMGTIPVEDTFYGMLLLLMNVVLFEELQKRQNKKSSR